MHCTRIDNRWLQQGGQGQGWMHPPPIGCICRKVGSGHVYGVAQLQQGSRGHPCADIHFDVVQLLEGDAFDGKRLLCGRNSPTVVNPDVLVYNDLGVLIRCDDAVTLPDGSVINCKTAQIKAAADTLQRVRALISLSCMLRDGESVTLLDKQVLNNRACLLQCLSCRTLTALRMSAEVFLRLGFLLRDPLETEHVDYNHRRKTLNGQQCFVEYFSSCSSGLSRNTCHVAAAYVHLGCCLKPTETVTIDNKHLSGTSGNVVVSRRDCFMRAVLVVDN